MTRIRIMALVVAVMLMMTAAVPAMAEAKLCTVTIDNVAIQHNADEPVKIGVGLQLAGGMDEQRGYVYANLTGDGKDIATFEAAMEGEQLTLALDGMSSNYSITLADAEQMIDDAMAGQGVSADMPFSKDDIQSLIESYIAGIQEAVELNSVKQSPEELQALYEAMGFVAGEDEEVQVNGHAMVLTRYDFDMDADGIDRIMSVTLEKMPSMKLYFEKYMDIMQKTMDASDEQIEFDPEHMFSSLFNQAGMQISVKGTMWMDEASENLRMEMTESVVGDESTVPEGIHVPIVMQLNTDERGQHLVYDIDMSTEETGDVKVSVKLNDAMMDEGAKGDFNMVIEAEGLVVTADANWNQDADGKGSFNASLVTPLGDGKEAKNTLAIASTGGDTNTHSIQLRSIGLQADGNLKREMSRSTVSLDITTGEAEMTTGALIDNGKPTVNLAAITDEQMETAQGELITKAIMSYGSVMQTEGVAKLISDAVMAMQEIFSTMTEAQMTVAT